MFPRKRIPETTLYNLPTPIGSVLPGVKFRFFFLKKKIHMFRSKERLFPMINHQTTVVRPLYLGLVLSGERPSSKAFLLLLLECCCCERCLSCCWWWCCCSSFSSCDRDSGFPDSSLFSRFSCFGSFNFVFIIWGLSLFTSDSRTGFKKNSSAPSFKHLLPIIHVLIICNSGVDNQRYQLSKSQTKGVPIIFLFSRYLLILEGTFSDDIITTGMSLRDEDSCQTRVNPINFFGLVCSNGKVCTEALSCMSLKQTTWERPMRKQEIFGISRIDLSGWKAGGKICQEIFFEQVLTQGPRW